jgi:hypothetical protein
MLRSQVTSTVVPLPDAVPVQAVAPTVAGGSAPVPQSSSSSILRRKPSIEHTTLEELLLQSLDPKLPGCPLKRRVPLDKLRQLCTDTCYPRMATLLFLQVLQPSFHQSRPMLLFELSHFVGMMLPILGGMCAVQDFLTVSLSVMLRKHRGAKNSTCVLANVCASAMLRAMYCSPVLLPDDDVLPHRLMTGFRYLATFVSELIAQEVMVPTARINFIKYLLTIVVHTMPASVLRLMRVDRHFARSASVIGVDLPTIAGLMDLSTPRGQYEFVVAFPHRTSEFNEQEEFGW